MINNSLDLDDLKIPPANRLEKLSGKLKDYYSIRINDQWRIIFKWIEGHSYEVEILKGRKRITTDIALRLSNYFGNSAKFWLGMQDY